MDIPKIQEAHVKGKRVLLRADLDVPLDHGSIVNDERLKAALPTIELLQKNGAIVIISGHLGRPKSQDQSFGLAPVAKWFANHFHTSNPQDTTIGQLQGWQLNDNLYILENLRFDEGEQTNSPEFVDKLASTADIYVDDAFAVTHRNNASITGICQKLPHFAGLHLQEEIDELSKVLDNPKRPLVVIIGGAKIETKLPLVEKMHKLADFVLVGGEIAEQTKVLLTVQKEKLHNNSVLLVSDLTQDKLDITHNSIENFLQVINKAATVVWNGPLGLIRKKEERDRDKEHDSERGTREVAKGIAESHAYSIIGGGDTLSYLDEIHILDKFSFVSTGGGAMLTFLSGKELPGIEALKKRVPL